MCSCAGGGRMPLLHQPGVEMHRHDRWSQLLTGREITLEVVDRPAGLNWFGRVGPVRGVLFQGDTLYRTGVVRNPDKRIALRRQPVARCPKTGAFACAGRGLASMWLKPGMECRILCRLLDDGGQLPQVDVADLREQVVLDLVVQASTHPRQHSAAGSKVGGGAQFGVKGSTSRTAPFSAGT